MATKEDLERFATTKLHDKAKKTSKDCFALRKWVEDIDERLMNLEAKQARKA